jgi:hypothetical protein
MTTLEWFGHSIDRDVRRESGRVHVVNRRRPDEIDVRLSADVDVTRDIGRILVQVGRIAELQRIHEDRHDDARSESVGPLNEAHVTGVKGSHGGNHRDGSRCAELVGSADGVDQRVNDSHDVR